MKLLLIEDDAAMQATLQRIFRPPGARVVVCGDGTRAPHCWRAAAPDVVLLNPGLRGRDGLALLADARAQGLDTPVLLLAERGTVDDRISGLDAGADDYLAGPFDLAELQARVRALARRSGCARAQAVQAASYCGLHTDPVSGAVYLHGRPMALSGRETALLRALLARPGLAQDKERLSDAVFAGDAQVQADAIEVVAYRLRKKLAGTPARLVTVRGLGYLLKAAA